MLTAIRPSVGNLGDVIEPIMLRVVMLTVTIKPLILYVIKLSVMSRLAQSLSYTHRERHIVLYRVNASSPFLYQIVDNVNKRIHTML
jgi:hypothetical protein